MNILIFTIGFIIFITYMFFLLRMVNKAHKSQERAQGKYNYKRQVRVTKKRTGSMGAGDYYIEDLFNDQFSSRERKSKR